MSTVDDIPLNARSLSYRWDGYDYTLRFDDEHLMVEWSSPTQSGSRKTPLRKLRPELPVERWVSDSDRKVGTLGVCLSVTAVVIYFSDIQPHVPLLAPALLIFGLLHLYWGVRAMLPFTKTVVRNRDNAYVISIPHFEHLSTQRKVFEEALLQTLKNIEGEQGAA
jgi:hypothetical protein